MSKIITILAAIELEADSRAVLARALQLAKAHAAALVVLHAIEAEPLSEAAIHIRLGGHELQDQLRRQTTTVIESLLAENERTRRTDVQVEFGSPHQVITQVARERHADVIVVGPGKGRRLKDRLLGSTADKVVRTSAGPILVIRTASTDPYRRVAVAIDGSPQSARAFSEAQRLAPDAALQLVQAVDIPLTFHQAMLRAGTSQVEMDRYRAARADAARDELSAFQRNVLKTTVPARVLDGEAGLALVRYSRRTRVDLLALGTQGRGAALQALLGSVARRVLDEATCDVLVTGVQQ